MSFAYNSGIPAANNNPSNDQDPMQKNFLTISNWVNVDHFGFGQQGGFNGYHDVIHQVPVLSAPATIAGIGQYFSQAVTFNSVSAMQLFYLSGGGQLSQITGYNAATNGWQWIGGVLVQWGVVTQNLNNASAAQLSTNFNVAFPNNLYNVQITPI